MHNTEFEIFRIKKGKEKRAKEWLELLIERKADCIKTLNREKMALESIFLTKKDNQLFLSWFSIQGKTNVTIDSSEHEIDKIHCKFWNECIDTTYKRDIFEHVVTYASSSVQLAIDDVVEKA